MGDGMSSGTQKVLILGTLGKDPELTNSKGRMGIFKFSLATTKTYKDKNDTTSWHKCVAFGKTAEVIAQYCGKGGMIHVEGELAYGQYEKDGIIRYTTEIIVKELTFISKNGSSGKPSDGSSNQQSNYSGNQNKQRPQQQQQQNQRPPQNDDFNPGGNEYDDYFNNGRKDDDIPF